jgi:hypothetical protein
MNCRMEKLLEILDPDLKQELQKDKVRELTLDQLLLIQLIREIRDLDSSVTQVRHKLYQ